MCRILRVLEGSERLNVSYFTSAGRLWEAKCVVFYVSGTLWEAKCDVFYVSGSSK